jgi:hypothetical protein
MGSLFCSPTTYTVVLKMSASKYRLHFLHCHTLVAWNHVCIDRHGHRATVECPSIWLTTGTGTPRLSMVLAAM